jgi:streptogramin lyase
MWMTEAKADKILRWGSPGAYTTFSVPTAASDPTQITAGPDGNMWFVENSANKIGRISPAGAIKEFKVPTADADLQAISAGPDGNVWFTEGVGQRIGRITPAGVITEFPVPSGLNDPQGITTGPDGALWFTAGLSNAIGRVTTAGVFKRFALNNPASDPDGITSGPEGIVYFTEASGGRIGQITTSGVITEYPDPSEAPAGITVGPDGNIWFADGNGVVGRLIPNTEDALVLPSALTPSTLVVPRGGTVAWTSEADGFHAIDDKVDVFGSTLDSGPLAPGSSYVFAFNWSGDFVVLDPGNGATEAIAVPMSVTPGSGTTATTFRLTWALSRPPCKCVFDVEIERPGTTPFVSWKTGTTALTGTFVAPTAGTYQWRVRMRDTGTGAASYYSPSVVVKVS